MYSFISSILIIIAGLAVVVRQVVVLIINGGQCGAGEAPAAAGLRVGVVELVLIG